MPSSRVTASTASTLPWPLRAARAGGSRAVPKGNGDDLGDQQFGLVEHAGVMQGQCVLEQLPGRRERTPVGGQRQPSRCGVRTDPEPPVIRRHARAARSPCPPGSLSLPSLRSSPSPLHHGRAGPAPLAELGASQSDPGGAARGEPPVVAGRIEQPEVGQPPGAQAQVLLQRPPRGHDSVAVGVEILDLQHELTPTGGLL